MNKMLLRVGLGTQSLITAALLSAVLAGGVGLTTSAFGATSEATSGTSSEPSLKFRGAGKTRDTLNAMHFKPFDLGSLSGLTNWQPAAPKIEDMNDKVILIVSWASWHRVSHPAMRTAERLYGQYKDKGLVVLGVHNPRGFENAAANAKELGVTFPFAEDKDGAFRTKLAADQDPNIYLIDRSGNMRYAQVDSSSLEDAVGHLIQETVDDARDVPAKLAREKAAAEKERWRTRDVSGVAPGQQIAVQFADPDEETYKKIKWPYLIGKSEREKITDRIINSPPKVELLEDQWMPAKPETRGKLTVLYIIDPADSDMLGAVDVMNKLQDKYRRDVVVVAQSAKLGEVLLNAQGEEAEKLNTRNTELLKSLIATRNVNHPMQPQPMKGEQFEFGGGGSSAIPVFGDSRTNFGSAMVIATDKHVRWIGSPYNTQDLYVALDKLIAIDPAVKARRKAEDAKTK